MPNHLMSKIHFSGDQSRIDELLESIKGDETLFDFNRVIPMPESLNIEASSRTDSGLRAYRDFITMYTMDGTIEKDLLNIPKEKEGIFLKTRPDIKLDEWNLGRTAFQNEQKYGSKSWFEFHIQQWGSKWNSYNSEMAEDNTIEFCTAWTNVKPVVIALSQKFPDIEMKYQWADEDIGLNMGDVTFKGGECIDEISFENDSKEAFEFAADMWGLDLEEEGLIFNEKSGTYERQDIRNSWVLYAEYANLGYTQSKTYKYAENKAAMHTCWTMKGRLFLYDFLRERGVFPMCEKECCNEAFV